MFIFDDSGNGNDSIKVDFDTWAEMEYDSATLVKSEKGYKSKFKNYVKSLIKDAGWKR